MADPLRLTAYIIFALYALTALWLLLNAMVQLHLLWHYKKRKAGRCLRQPLPNDLPFVSIQIPIYNEKFVIGRLLHALAQLDYPKDRFEIQVLDDSTDDTSAIVDETAAQLQASNISISVLRRKNRKGFKAGALQAGLPFCKGELIAIFDADFYPDPGFLKKLIPCFSDPEVGLIQARWSHLNREQNALTRIQTYLLDTHFSIEQTGRSNAGYFINFCGTAGIWRKQCIEDAGGWDGDVLSEDLDLSYRAQLKGWKLLYDQETEVPAELPAVIEAFKTQQFRWTKGMAQISRKNMRKLIGSTLPLGKKLHGVFHLLSSFVFVCLFINALLTVPLLVFRNLYPEIMEWSKYTLITALNLVVITLFYYSGARTSAEHKGSLQFFRHYPFFLVIYMGLSVQNACAVLQGFFGVPSAFIRTPKFNDVEQKSTYLENKISWINILEGIILCYFLGGIALSFYFGDYFLMLFFVMIGVGLGFILYQSIATALQPRLIKSLSRTRGTKLPSIS